MSIADVNRLWLKSRVGLPITEIARDFAFCNYTIRDDAPPVFIVLDADQDPRFFDKGFVTGPPYAKFYAGAPVMCNNIKLGSFCVLDGVPHDDFDEEAQEMLVHFASLASDLIAQHKEAKFIAKYDPSLLNLAILQLLKDPLNASMSLQGELSQAYKAATMSSPSSVAFPIKSTSSNNESKQSKMDKQNVQKFISKFDEFHTNVSLLQTSLEVALRFATSVAYRPTPRLFKRKTVAEYSGHKFAEEFRRLTKVEGYKASEFSWNEESARHFNVMTDPVTLASIAGFLSLKRLNVYATQQIRLSLLPATLDSDYQQNYFSDQRRGYIQVDLCFSDPCPSRNAPYINTDAYDYTLISEILFGINGTFDYLHPSLYDAESKEVVEKQCFCIQLATTFAPSKESPGMTSSTYDGSMEVDRKSQTNEYQILSRSTPVGHEDGSASVGSFDDRSQPNLSPKKQPKLDLMDHNRSGSQDSANSSSCSSATEVLQHNSNHRQLHVHDQNNSSEPLSPFADSQSITSAMDVVTDDEDAQPLHKQQQKQLHSDEQTSAESSGGSSGGGSAKRGGHALDLLVSLVTSRPGSAKVHP